MVNVRSWVNQQCQLGIESTPGTAVAATQLLLSGDYVFGIEAGVTWYGATGRKYDTIQEEDVEWTSGSMTGPIDYNYLVYYLSGAMGAATIGAHGSSNSAKDWVFTPPVSGNASPKTYTFEQGDSNFAHKVAYGLFNSFGYKGTRNGGMSLDGKLMCQQLTNGITMTPGLTGLAQAPAPAKHFNIYLDSTYGALGTTLLSFDTSIEFIMDGIYMPYFAFDRSKLGWTQAIDAKPKTTFKMLLMADTAGMAPLVYLQNGTTYFLRIDAQGLVIDNLQIGTISGGPSSGNFILTYKTQSTPSGGSGLSYNATGAQVQTALRLLSLIGNNVTVTGGAGGPYRITFIGDLAQDTTALTVTNTFNVGTIAITQNQSYNKFTHDMAVKFDKPDPFSNAEETFAIGWNGRIVEDSGWTHAQLVTVTNVLTSL